MPSPANIVWETLLPAARARPDPADQILQKALTASAELADLVTSAANANEPILLIVNDPHRSTQTRPALIALSKLIAGADGRSETLGRSPRFRALVAAGAHRFPIQERREFELSVFADSGLSIEEIRWHDARGETLHGRIGGMRMHGWVAESRWLLPIGSVEPHYFAGVTGPHKTVTIGCMSFEDIERNHAGALDPAADILRLKGNPVYDGIVGALRDLKTAGKTICAIGEVVCSAALLEATIGDPINVIDALLPSVRRAYLRRIFAPVDVLRLRVPLPLGRSVYQADKALKNNHLAVRDGGGIILEADCPEGVGPGAFLHLLRQSNDYATAQRMVADRGYRLGDHKALKLRYLMDPECRGVRVAFVSRNLAPSDWSEMGIGVFSRVQPALRWLADSMSGPLASGLIIEDAGMLCVTSGRQGA